MRVHGITYDTGFLSGGTTTHEPFDPVSVAGDMRVIREELHCTAVRITGGDQDRLELAARHAADVGLEVWYSPFTHRVTRDELLAFVVDGAERAAKIPGTVYLTGSEISIFTTDLLDNGPLTNDFSRIRTEIGELREKVDGFLAEAVTAVRARFDGPISYASLPHEGVDWSRFDIIASDAGYRDANSAPGFRDSLRALTAQGKPFAVTEFGCAPYRGAADLGARSDIIEWGDDARPRGLTRPVERDEQEQADYLDDVYRTLVDEGVDAAFVYTFARWDIPGDYDVGSFGVVRVAPGGRSWERKAAFDTMAGWSS